MQGKAKMNRYITIEKFIDILNEENLPQERACTPFCVNAFSQK